MLKLFQKLNSLAKVSLRPNFELRLNSTLKNQPQGSPFAPALKVLEAAR
jgi:hypothetical protein